MLKLLKKLKPYTFLVVVTVVLISVYSLSAIFLPDRMSDIINNGIVEEVVFEKTENGEDIFVDLSLFAEFLGENTPVEMPLPKIIYQDAGELVTYVKDGKHYATINFASPFELDAKGEVITMLTLDAEGNLASIPVPKFEREYEGKLVLQDNGSAQIATQTRAVYDEIWKNGAIMLAIALVSSICSIIAAYFSAGIGSGFGRDLRLEIFQKVTSFSAKQSDSFGTASLITRATNDVTQIQTLIITGLRTLVMVPVMFVGGLTMALSKSRSMTLVLLALVPVIALIVIVAFKIIIPLFKSMQKKTDKLTLVARENITGVRVIRAFGADERENQRFDEANLDLSLTGLKAARVLSGLLPVLMMIMSITSLGIVMIGAFYVNNALKSSTFTGETAATLGNMMAVIQYVMQIMFSVFMLALMFFMLPRASVSAARINELLESSNTIKDPDTPAPLDDVAGVIKFDNVSFAYGNAENNVLENISFTACPGEVTALIGSTGSGKSTLINLIPRLYDVTGGSIKLDGQDIKEFSQGDLRQHIGFVSQKPVLFSGTIRDNIAYGNGDVNDEDIVRAAEIAQAADFIAEKSGGYLAEVEQNGANFSGGQKQRISIARAVARKPKIYIFDDCFSALDFKTDAKLRAAIKNELTDSTVFIVAQRIGTVMDADRIVVLLDGKLSGIGKHKELLETCAVYREIALSQMSEEELGLAAGGAV
ncbi:MAG: ABC transporter ATP-binding protein [Clostridia bacterium]